MRILRFYRSLNPVYGGIVSAIEYTSGALAAEHMVEIATLDDFELCGKNIRIRHTCLFKAGSFYGFNFRSFRKAVSLAKNSDIIQIEGGWNFVNIIAFVSCVVARKRYYYTPHGMLDSYFKEESYIKHLKKMIYWFLVEVWIVRFSDRVIYTTKKERDRSRFTFPFTSKNDDVIPLCVADLAIYKEDFDYRESNVKDKVNLLYLSRLHPKKGLESLLNAISFLPRAVKSKLTLTIAGSGEAAFEESIRRLIVSLDLVNCVSWVGFADVARKVQLYRECDIFCLTSFQENFGLVVPEALAFNKPVFISSDVYIHDLVESYGAGVVVEITASSSDHSEKLEAMIIDVSKNVFNDRPRKLFESEFSSGAFLSAFNKVLLDVQTQ